MIVKILIKMMLSLWHGVRSSGGHDTSPMVQHSYPLITSNHSLLSPSSRRLSIATLQPCSTASPQRSPPHPSAAVCLPPSQSRLLPTMAFSSARTAFSTGAVIARARSAKAFSTTAAFYIGPTATFSIRAASPVPLASSTPVNFTRQRASILPRNKEILR
jgi:hypothetical protein